MRSPAEPGVPASLALAALVAVAIAAPWAFGAVQPRALLAVAAAALLAGAVALLVGARRGLALPAVPLWPALGFLALALGQLVPVPAAVHALLAPGSHAVWHPGESAVAGVLGAGPHPVSVDPDATLVGLALTGGLVLLSLLAAPALSRPLAASRAVAVVGAAGFALSAYAILARARFGALLYGTIPVPTVSPFGPFVSKNHFAGWIAMAALLVAGLALGLANGGRGRGSDWTTGPRAGAVVLSIVAALSMALAGLASMSRGGAIALAAGGACFLGLRVWRGSASRRGGLAASLSLALVLGLVLLALVPAGAQERMRSLSGASFRLGTWRDAVRLAATSPVVGHGLGAFHDAYPRFKQGHGEIRVEHAENDYVETLAETGLAGLALALAGLFLLLGVVGRGLVTGADRTVRGVGAGAAAALAALAVHSLVDFNLRIPSNAALAALAASAAAGAAGVRPRSVSRPAALSVAAVALVLLLAAATRPESPWRAARHEAGAAAAAVSPEVRRLRLERAEVALVRVLRRRPAHAESWLMLAGTRAARGDRAAAASLARHAVWLDPGRPGLREAAERLGAGDAGGVAAP